MTALEATAIQDPTVIDLRDQTVAPRLTVDARRAVVAPTGPYVRFVKPLFDRSVAAVLLVVTAPVFAAIAVAVALRLGRPILFHQDRVGLNGKVFSFTKFRSMEPDRRVSTQPYDGVERRVMHKTDDDPRHTPLGRLLRGTSLDELPQLWHVLRGEMSLVGPRPEVAAVADEQYAEWQHARHVVKPGVTGLWQVTTRSEGRLLLEDVEVDLDYVRTMSFLTDLKILLATPRAALKRSS